MMEPDSDSKQLLSGNEAVALAALHAGVALGTGYPGTPSTEILERFSDWGGKAQWAPNEKVAFEVALGVAFGGMPVLVTMKHVGLNVAADPLFTSAYSGVPGALVVVSADDPGLASSQNEQDNRRYAVAAGVPMFEPADSQEAYDFMLAALQISAQWHLPVMLRMTTRICHSKTMVTPHRPTMPVAAAHYERDVPGHVMIPAHARPAHHRLRRKLAEIAAWNEKTPFNRAIDGDASLGIITSGVVFQHVREAAPQAAVLKLGLTHPLPLEQIRQFVETVDACVVIEENDPYLFEQIRAAGIAVDQKPEPFRFGELNVDRVRRILAKDMSPEAKLPPGKAPELCAGCPHRATFGVLKKLDCIVIGDIGCYTLGALPPVASMDTQLCMGASVGMGLGLRHVLPETEARRIVSVIGDSTFLHSGITGLVEMVYNPPPTGHVLVILDNRTTAMTGLQEHPATGRSLDGEPAHRVVLADLVRSLGVGNVHNIDPAADAERFEQTLRDALKSNELTVIIAERRCLLAAAKEKKREMQAKKSESGEEPAGSAAEVAFDHEAASFAAPALSLPRNIIIAGLGGQGVLTASDILAEAALLSGYDVKKAEVHGMAQRGGSVACDIRFGQRVLSPMVPPGEADFLVVLAEDQVEHNRPRLRAGGVLITPSEIANLPLPNRRSANTAQLGVLSRHLGLADSVWREAIRRHLKPELYETNWQAFQLGRGQ